MPDIDEPKEDEELLGELRMVWDAEDPAPSGLADRMVAAAAVDDLNREFELLTIVEGDKTGSVRRGSAPRTVHFADDDAEVLIRVSAERNGTRRVDGWSRPAVLAARLAQPEVERKADTAGDGRFTFDEVPPGPSHMRMVVKQDENLREVMTQWFEV
ncbi:hypothetical protein [Microbacterium sp. G2-8]|uniref:hypothetical protein n=1 Tax=Microbacterium sp. G2-8 TaxID=2842454 RepID=UPI001C8948B2|nr:hypothetical protein [Microbacterium sp. G2-8]